MAPIHRPVPDAHTVPLSLVSWEIFLLAHSHATCCHSAGFFCCNAAWEAKLGFPFPTLSWGVLSLSLKSSRAPSSSYSWKARLGFPFYPLLDPTDPTPCHGECCLYLVVESPWKKRSSFHDDLASSTAIEDSPRGLEGIKCDSRNRTGQGESLRSVEKILRVFQCRALSKESSSISFNDSHVILSSDLLQRERCYTKIQFCKVKGEGVERERIWRDAGLNRCCKGVGWKPDICNSMQSLTPRPEVNATYRVWTSAMRAPFLWRERNEKLLIFR